MSPESSKQATDPLVVTGLILAIPAFTLPLVTVSTVGGIRNGYLLTGADAYWNEGLRVLGVWVAVCGAVAPLLLLGLLAVLAWPALVGGRSGLHQRFRRTAVALEYWSAPEVHVLAVLVALSKLGSLVQVSVGPGLWFYAAMSVAILAAWRNSDLE